VDGSAANEDGILLRCDWHRRRRGRGHGRREKQYESVHQVFAWTDSGDAHDAVLITRHALWIRHVLRASDRGVNSAYAPSPSMP
jgi:hypothetical protein